MSGMSPDDHESYRLAGLAGLYALDALEGEELARFEALLETNAELRDEVAGFRATAARLSEVSVTAPPASMKAEVLARVAATRQDPPIVRLDDRRRARTRQRVVLAAAAALLVVVAGVGGFLLADRSAEAPTSQLASVLARGDATVVPLVGAESKVGAGHVVVSPGTKQVIVVSASLDPIADDRTYELWKLDEKGAHRAGLFEPGADGSVEAAIPLDAAGATGFAVTEEPAGGSDQPTGSVLMSAELE